MKHKYNGITAEEAFKNMGHPELIEKYRKNDDKLDQDFRVTVVVDEATAFLLDDAAIDGDGRMAPAHAQHRA